MKSKGSMVLALLCLAVIALAGISCKQESKEAAREAAKSPESTDKIGSAASDATVPVFIDKKENIRRSGTITVEVDDVARTSLAVRGIMDEVKGEVLNEDIRTESNGLLRATLKIRIPAENFTKFLARINVLGKVLDMKIESQDLTDDIKQKDAEIGYLKKKIGQTDRETDEQAAQRLERDKRQKEHERYAIKKTTLFSYIQLVITQREGFLDSIVSGLGIASGILKVLLKIIIVLVAVLAPIALIAFGAKFLYGKMKK